MKPVKPLLTAAVVVAVAAPASAFFGVPQLVIDPAAIAKIVAETQQAIAEVQQTTILVGQARQNLQNLGNFNGLLGALKGEALAVWQRSHAGSPVRMGSDAAAQVDVQTQSVDAHIAAANDAARSANGALSAAQAQALYLDTIATEEAKANELHAAESEQAQNKEDALTAAIRVEAGDGVPIGVR